MKPSFYFNKKLESLDKINRIIDKCSVLTLNTSDRGTDEEIDVIDKEELKNKLGMGKQEPLCKCSHSFFQHSQAHERCDYCDCKKFDCQHINKDIEIDEKRFLCNDCNEWINCEDLKEKIYVRCMHCGYEKEYKTKNKEECVVKSKGHKPHHKFRIIKNKEGKNGNS